MRRPSSTFPGAMRAPLLAFLASFALIACGQSCNLPGGSTVMGPERVASVEQDGGVSDGSAPDSITVADESQAEPAWARDCPSEAAAPEPSFRSIRFELTPGETVEGPDMYPVPWEVRITGEDQEAFPAQNREGTILVQRFSDASSFADETYDSVGFFSVVTGKTLGFFMLSSNLRNPSPAEVRKERRRLEGAVAAMNRILGKRAWKRVASGRKPTGPCPGTPFTKLDQERSLRDNWKWERVTRFEREGLDFEYQPPRDENWDPAKETVTIRALQADGTIRTVTLPHELFPPGRTNWMSDEQGRCGWSEGFDGFGSRELGIFFVYGDENFAGDSCQAEVSGRRLSVIRLPPELRTKR